MNIFIQSMAKTHTQDHMHTHTHTNTHTHTHTHTHTPIDRVDTPSPPPPPPPPFFFSFFLVLSLYVIDILHDMSQSQHQHCQADLSLMIKARPLLTSDMCIDVTCFVELFHSFQFEFWWLWLYGVSQSSARLHRFWSQKIYWFNTTVCVFLGISSVIESLILVRCRLLFPSFCIL